MSFTIKHDILYINKHLFMRVLLVAYSDHVFDHRCSGPGFHEAVFRSELHFSVISNAFLLKLLP